MNLRCQSCGAALELDPSLRTALCPYCGSTSIVERPPEPDRPAPAFAAGFAIPRAAVFASVRAWLGARTAFARSGLKRAALESLKGIYVPAYLYGAVAETDWSADIGERYTEEESYEAQENGKTVKKTRQVTRTEWRPLSGRRSEHVSDVVVTASKGLRNDELESIEPFDLKQLRRYQSALLAGWVAEEPTLKKEESLELARGEARQMLAARLERFLPGDEHRALSAQTRLQQESLDLCLLPVWVLAARWAEDKPPMRIVVNGQTGAVAGKVPLSWVKIASVALVAAAALGGIIWFVSQHVH